MNYDFAIEERSLGDAPAFTLHPVRGVVWAAFLGSPVAAGIIMALNYSRMGNKSAARTTVAVGVIATAALMSLAFAIPDDVHVPNSVLFVPQLIVVYLIADRLQGNYIRKHRRRGGTVASAWPSVGIGFLCLSFILGAIFGMFLLLEPSIETVVKFGNDEVYYTGDATEDDARKLARVLQDMEIFGSSGASVRLESSSGRYTACFVVVEHAWDDPEVVDAFKDVGRNLVDSGFPAPLAIQLCDDYFAAQKTFMIP